MTALWTALGGLLSGLAVVLVGMISTQASALRLMLHESEVIDSMPEGSERRKIMEEAADLSAQRYLAHAQNPFHKRRLWYALVTGAATLVLSFVLLSREDGHPSIQALIALGSFIGFIVYSWAASNLMRR